MKCFLGDNSTDARGFFLSQIESAIAYINSIDHIQLKIPKEEFERKYNEAKEKYKNIDNIYVSEK